MLKPRRILQIACGPHQIVALADDGLLWSWGEDGKWSQYIDPLPGIEIEEEDDGIDETQMELPLA